MTQTLEYIKKRKKMIAYLLEVDIEIDANPYDNIARLKEVEAIEKCLRKEIETLLSTGKLIRH
jgi:hypothetical protein